MSQVAGAKSSWPLANTSPRRSSVSYRATPDRLMAVPLFLQPCMEVLKVTLQVPSILFLGDPQRAWSRCPSYPSSSV